MGTVALTVSCIILENGQTARFLKYVWPFSNNYVLKGEIG